MLKLIEDPEANHLRQMAKQLGASLEEGSTISSITMKNEKANGVISSYRLFNGLSVWVYNVTFGSKFNVELELAPNGPVYFCYNVKGHFFHRFGKQEEFARVLQSQSMIVKGSPNNRVEITFPENVELEIAIIIVDIALLRKPDNRNAKRFSAMFEKIFKNIPENKRYRHLGNIDVETSKYASLVCKNKNTDLVSELLTEGAILNMLASQIKTYQKEITQITPVLNLTKLDLSKISSLGDHVINNFTKGITILELSQHFGLSPKKLQVGVKHLYGDTVGHYILNLRMGHGKYLCETTDLNVSEICDLIGISSHSYFSKLFKNRYGVSPSKFRNALMKA